MPSFRTVAAPVGGFLPWVLALPPASSPGLGVCTLDGHVPGKDLSRKVGAGVQQLECGPRGLKENLEAGYFGGVRVPGVCVLQDSGVRLGLGRAPRHPRAGTQRWESWGGPWVCRLQWEVTALWS